ncbi:MAG: hypothetical protein COV33_01685 [Candidatus Zambryskibacteria bacterium CG10_big_fil_rev_8_21_14_0_10_34_34]|uniref:Type II secretion system protein GspI C-terminal domain-containing protein n=1 Tax=Candidatus Zambryskibacteria bacterium CG10_big_fil_rev_8_21_14_0_10_34_34 TaxID=1975114 RepID=A0A2H0R0Q2_9BACT|nr:MAG: hypothetical protein COV33_01685 [Candidatus Zambryskibacteria bacterium CG10_big_fil_rev_8_21_14_0_10_34_34]
MIYKKIFNFKFSILNFAKKQQGFTVLESIVAILILSLSISGAFSAVQQGFSQSIIAKDEIKASFLAQEAVEVIKNIRDSNQLYKIQNPSTSRTWLYKIAESGDPCGFGNTCRVDITTPTSGTYLYTCSGGWGSCNNLSQNQTNYIYAYSGVSSNFKREVQIESISADEISVTVRVYWTKGLVTRDFKVKTVLFNWI